MSIGARSAAILGVLAVAAGAALTACGEESVEAAGSWRELRPGPLSPREGALGVWTGREALVIGGSDARPCPPSAQCPVPRPPPLRDGAAFDPRTGTWRRIADAPVGFDFAGAAVVGRTVYVAIPGNAKRPGSPSALLAYRPGSDRWRRLRPPPRPRSNYTLLTAGRRLIAYGNGSGRRDPAGFVLDARTRAWRPLPPDPLPRSRAQAIAWTGRELVLFRHAPDRLGAKPPLAGAAALQPGTGRWRTLAESEDILFGPVWVRAGARLVNPTLGTADGGGNDWGSSYPKGGILEPRTGRWTRLPDAPGADELTFGIGVLTRSRGQYVGGTHGLVLDVPRDRWIRVPRVEPERVHVGSQTVVNAGRRLLVFGGARFDAAHPGGRLLRTARAWAPPAGGR